MLSPVRSRKQMLTQQQRNNRRRRANPRQLAFLRKKFLEDPKPDQSTREQIGRVIDMTPRSVQIWFQNNRAKTKEQDRKFSANGKLYSMTTTACSKNVSCVRANFDNQAYMAFDHHDDSFYTPSPVRFYTPQPEHAHMSRACSSPRWEHGSLNSSSHWYNSDVYGASDLPNNSGSMSDYSGLRAQSVHNLGYTGTMYPSPPRRSGKIQQFDFFHNQQQYYNMDEEPNEEPANFVESLLSFDNGSSTSIIGSPESYDGNYDDPSSLYQISHCGVTADSPADVCSEHISLNSEHIYCELLDPILSSAPESDGASAPPSTFSLPGEEVELTQLMNTMHLNSESALTAAADYINIPCSCAKIGNFIAKNSGGAPKKLAVCYSPAKQVLHVAITDIGADRIYILERDVLHIPKPSALRATEHSCSQIDIEVFGQPRLATIDTAGRQMATADPTNSAISSAHVCSFYGDYSEHYEVMSRIDEIESISCENWLNGVEDSKLTLPPPMLAIDTDLPTNASLSIDQSESDFDQSEYDYGGFQHDGGSRIQSCQFYNNDDPVIAAAE